jgi:hypothetical protein
MLFRVAHGEAGGFRWSSEYGVWCPTPLMKLTQGYAFPTWPRAAARGLVPGAHRRHRRHARRGHRNTLTFNADVAVGVPLTDNDATGPGSIAPLDDLLAPVTTGIRLRVTAPTTCRSRAGCGRACTWACRCTAETPRPSP